MIEDKELGLKVAENKLEALWTKVVEARKSSIEALKDSLIVEEAFLKMAEAEVKKALKAK